MKENPEVNTEVLNEDASSSPLVSAMRQVSPIVMGYLPVGAAFGVLAHKTGLSLLSTVLMSVIVYAGSAQLIAVALFAAGAPPLSIVATTFVVNLRHMLLSASLAPWLQSWGLGRIAAFTFQLTDESFALHLNRFTSGDTARRDTFAINMIAQGAWVTGSALGIFSSNLIGDVRPIGLDFALPGMFIALLVPQIRERLHLVVALLAGALSTLLLLSGLDQWSVITATVLAATFGAGVETWMKQRS